jgi:hypothetical protein
MLHESIKQKQFTIKERADFRLRVQSHEVIAPKGVYSIDFIQESIKDGKVKETQTYNFFLTKADIRVLCNGLLND